MKNYKDLYAWRIEETVRNGKEVFILDRGKSLSDPVIIANDLPAEDFFKLIDEIKADKQNRYLAWTIEVIEDDKEDGTDDEDPFKILG